jgi:hypothetical protein
MRRRSKTKPMIEPAPMEIGEALGKLRPRDEAILERIDEDYARLVAELSECGYHTPSMSTQDALSGAEAGAGAA